MPQTAALFACDGCNTELHAGPQDFAVECPRCFNRVVVPRRARDNPFQPPEQETRFSLHGSGQRPMPMCGDHPDRLAGWHCDRCGKMLCAQCVDQREVRGLRLEVCACGGRCVPLSDADKGTRPADAKQMSTAFGYPLQGQGLGLLIVGALFLWISLFVASHTFFFIALSMILFVWGYLSAYLIKVISTTALGEDDPPEWPAAGDMWESILRPLLLLSFAGALCFGPAFCVLFTASLPPVAFWLLLALGGFVFPMALTAVAMAQSVTALNPFLLIRSIARVSGSYCLACGLFFFAAILRILGETASGFIPYVGDLVIAAVSLYFLMVQARVLGIIYRINQDKLEWF